VRTGSSVLELSEGAGWERACVRGLSERGGGACASGEWSGGVGTFRESLLGTITRDELVEEVGLVLHS
jgi:hypothetical protein